MTSYLHKTLCLPCLLFFLFPCRAQELVYKHYDFQDGLANSTIHSIFQDKEGFLWIGTESGLCRYDGSRFKTFTAKDGLPGNEVFQVFEDSKGRLWLQLYNNRIAYIYQGRIHNQENDSLLRKINLKSRVYGIAEDGEGNIGLCDYSDVYIIQQGNGPIQHIYSSAGKNFFLIQMYTDQHKNLMVVSNYDIYKIEKAQLKLYKSFVHHGYGLAPNECLFDSAYSVYGNNGDRTIDLKDTTIHLMLPDFSLKYSRVSDSVFSINTTNGTYLFNTINYNIRKVLPGFKVTNVFTDREKNLWIGTVSKGLYKISSPFITNYKINDQQNDIYFITKEKDRILAGNNTLNIFEYHDNTLTKRNLSAKSSRFMLKPYYYERLNDHTYFLAHDMGIMNIENGKAEKEVVTHMLKQVSPVDKDHVLIAIHAGLCLVRKKGPEIIDTIWKHKSLSSFQTNDSILAGTISGLFILEKQNGHYQVADSLLPHSIIGSIKKTANNCIWVCTNEDGLYCLANGTIVRHFSDSSGLPSNNTRSLFVHNNDVWLGTDKGLVKITPAQDGFQIKKYSTSDGLPSNTINSIYADSNIIYLGTPEGLCHFDEQLIETPTICNLVLTAVKIGDSLVNFSDKYVLNRNQRFVIDYAGISFRSEQEMTYRYMIKGIDDNWRTTTQSSLEFMALPYGDYELAVVAINKQGKESQPLTILFHIRRPFYRTAWFIVLIALLLVSATLLYNTWRLNLVKKKQLHKLQQEIKMLELEQMALRLQMNPHFIFNCISTVQQLVAENDASNTDKFITSFSSLVRQTLDNAPELLIPLNEEIKFLNNYFELERIRLEDRFSYAINTIGINDINQLHVPNMVIQPFAENAIRHGVRYKKDGKGHIEVNFEQRGDVLRCTITDNGIGRQRAAQIKKELGIPHSSKGMSITLQRIASLNMLTHRNIRIDIQDMKDENYHATGTKVIIDFKADYPYDKDSYN